MSRIIACMGMAWALAAPVFGQDWWEREDWTLLSDRTSGRYKALYGAHDSAWLYFRLDLTEEFNPFPDGVNWHFGVRSGIGFSVFNVMDSDATLWWVEPEGAAQEQYSANWIGNDLLHGEIRSSFLSVREDYHPFHTDTRILCYRVPRILYSERLHAARGNGYLFGAKTVVDVLVRRGDDGAYIHGSYRIP